MLQLFLEVEIFTFKQMGVFMMYFDFLEDHITDYGDEEQFDWSLVSNRFVRSYSVSKDEIDQAEQRLLATNYHIPEELKAFWSEIGCGYLCSNFVVDNAIEAPNTMLDIYFSEGEWGEIKTSFNLLVPNELPFLRTNVFNYITIGLEENYNLGKIYLNGEEIAPNLPTFIKEMLKNPIYYR